MADRRFPIVTDQFYHVFNRGVAKQPMFLNKKDYEQAMLTLSYYRYSNLTVRLSRFKDLSLSQQQETFENLATKDESLVKIVSFVLMPNHFHFLLQQVRENGIATFISQFANSYTKYFNTKNSRVGPVFQGVYKAVLVEADEQFIHLSRYIHLNPVTSFIIRESELFSYPWSSLPDFLLGGSSLIWAKPVLDHFKSVEGYRKFVLDQVDYGRKLEEIKHLALDFNN